MTGYEMSLRFQILKIDLPTVMNKVFEFSYNSVFHIYIF